MATITFSSTDPQIEAQALRAVLDWWLRELPVNESPRPASAKFVYVDGLVRLEVNVEPAPPVDEPE